MSFKFTDLNHIEGLAETPMGSIPFKAKIAVFPEGSLTLQLKDIVFPPSVKVSQAMAPDIELHKPVQDYVQSSARPAIYDSGPLTQLKKALKGGPETKLSLSRKEFLVPAPETPRLSLLCKITENEVPVDLAILWKNEKFNISVRSSASVLSTAVTAASAKKKLAQIAALIGYYLKGIKEALPPCGWKSEFLLLSQNLFYLTLHPSEGPAGAPYAVRKVSGQRYVCVPRGEDSKKILSGSSWPEIVRVLLQHAKDKRPQPSPSREI
jgi:hypothetical protein